MLKLNYFLADIFILSAEKQPIKLSWRKIEWLLVLSLSNNFLSRELEKNLTCLLSLSLKQLVFPVCRKNFTETSTLKCYFNNYNISVIEIWLELVQLFPTIRHSAPERSYPLEIPLMNPQIDSQCFVS